MKNKFTPALKICFITVALSTLATLQANSASYPYDNIVASNFFTEYPDQLEFPIILIQPLNQLVPAGAGATFTVGAVNEPLAYQWMRNGVIISGETNSSLIITNAQIANVGLYSCNVAKGLEIVPTRAAQLMVYVNSAALNTDKIQFKVSLDGGSTPVTVYATPVTSGGSGGTCPGAYVGYVNYTKTAAQGWGWAPDSGTTTHTATDTNRVDTKVQYAGKLGDTSCNQTTVTVPDPTYSTKYRFTIYFTNNVPTNAYSIVLDGFNP